MDMKRKTSQSRLLILFSKGMDMEESEDCYTKCNSSMVHNYSTQCTHMYSLLSVSYIVEGSPDHYVIYVCSKYILVDEVLAM